MIRIYLAFLRAVVYHGDLAKSLQSTEITLTSALFKNCFFNALTNIVSPLSAKPWINIFVGRLPLKSVFDMLSSVNSWYFSLCFRVHKRSRTSDTFLLISGWNSDITLYRVWKNLRRFCITENWCKVAKRRLRKKIVNTGCFSRFLWNILLWRSSQCRCRTADCILILSNVMNTTIFDERIEKIDLGFVRFCAVLRYLISVVRMYHGNTYFFIWKIPNHFNIPSEASYIQLFTGI